MMQSVGSMAAHVLIWLPVMLGFQGLQHGRVLNFHHRESKTADGPVADQAGHQCQ